MISGWRYEGLRDRQKSISGLFPFFPFYNPRAKGVLSGPGIVRHNLLSANRRGADVKHAQTRVPGLMPGAVAFVLSVSFFDWNAPGRAGIISGFVRFARGKRLVKFDWVVILPSRSAPRLFPKVVHSICIFFATIARLRRYQYRDDIRHINKTFC